MVASFSRVLPSISLVGLALQLLTPVCAQNYRGPGSTVTPGTMTPGYDYSITRQSTGQFPACPPQQGRVVYIPAGMTMSVSLSTAISTDVAKPGDLVQATLTQPITLNDGYIPAGTAVSGQVVSARSGGFLGRAGMLTVKFNTLHMPNGIPVPLSAHIIGDIGKYAPVSNGSDTFAGETWKNKVGQTVLRGVVGAGAGAALGTAVGAIATNGHGYGAGRGAWSGAAIGGGVGAADGLLLRKGKNVVIPSGTAMQLQLDSPSTLSQNMQNGAF